MSKDKITASNEKREFSFLPKNVSEEVTQNLSVLLQAKYSIPLAREIGID